MKAIADSFTNADKVLAELFAFERIVEEIAAETDPYPVGGNGRPLPRFITETSVALRKKLVKDFAIAYPNIHSLVENGNSADVSLGRLHDACYKFNQVQQAIYKANCVIMTDDIREDMREKLNDVVGDLCVFIITQYGLYKLEGGVVPMSIHAHCEKYGMTPDVLYGSILGIMEEVDRTWYAYEPMSPVYNDLMEADPVFLSECEENMYPLTDDMAKKIIDGTMDSAYARSLLMAHMKDMIEKDVDVTPASLLSQMRLE